MCLPKPADFAVVDVVNLNRDPAELGPATTLAPVLGLVDLVLELDADDKPRLTVLPRVVFVAVLVVE
jgi:hypothetical protein